MTIRRNILIDANNLFHRSYAVHVKDKPPESLFTNTRGYPTGFIYGVYSMLQDWIGEIGNPNRIMFFMDGKPTRRLAIDEMYKYKEESDRPGVEDYPIELSDGFSAKTELDVIFHLGSLLGWDLYCDKNEEADDLIASFVKTHMDDVNIIISSDKDFYALLAKSDKNILYRPGMSGNRFFDAQAAEDDMMKKYKVKVPPCNMRMFKALTGDASDNIKGVPRLRKKVAAPMCGYSTIDEVINTGLPGFSRKEQEGVIYLKEQLEKNLELVDFFDDLDIEKYKTEACKDLKTAQKIFSDDLDMMSIRVDNFDTGMGPVTRNSVAIAPPDWLDDII